MVCYFHMGAICHKIFTQLIIKLLCNQVNFLIISGKKQKIVNKKHLYIIKILNYIIKFFYNNLILSRTYKFEG